MFYNYNIYSKSTKLNKKLFDDLLNNLSNFVFLNGY